MNKYTPQLDNIVSSVGHVLSQATNAYLNNLIATKQIPEPTSQEEIDKLGHELLTQIAMLATIRIVTNPEGVLYEQEVIPFLESVMEGAPQLIGEYTNANILVIESDRPEGTPPPEVPNKVEEDPILKAKQGKSSIIIPGIND